MRIFLLLTLPILVFSFEVNFNKKFTKTLKEDTLTSQISIIIEAENEEKVNKNLILFSNKIDLFNKVEKSNGTLIIRPKYGTYNKTPKIIAYTGELRYKVSSNKAKNINDFISETIKLKKNNDTSIVINNLKWVVKDETINLTYDNLRLEAIEWANSYSKKLSKKLNQKCKLKNISINNTNYSPLSRMVYSNAKTSTAEIALPQSNKEDISINSSFVLECN